MADKIRQHPELVAVARQLLARVGDQALTFHQPRVVEQYRSDYRELVRRSSGVHPDLRLEVARAQYSSSSSYSKYTSRSPLASGRHFSNLAKFASGIEGGPPPVPQA